MGDLNETLGHLLCEITRARMSADLEAVRIAKLYASDPDGLLRNFPIPRMRMPNVEVSLPVIVSSVPEGYTSRIAPDMLVSTLAKNLKESLKGQKINVSTEQIQKIINADKNLSKGLINSNLADNLIQQIVDQTRKKADEENNVSAAEALSESSERFKVITDIIKAQVRRTLDALPQQPVGIAIDARTSQVKEAGQGNLCLTLKISVHEDGLEMLFEEPEEGQKKAPALKSLSPE